MKRMFLFMMLLQALACKKNETPAVAPGPTPVVPGFAQPNTWLALGDSYTIGQGVAASERFPAQTVEFLIQKNISISALDYIATTGWTTTDLQNAINNKKPENHTIVSLLIGVNDQYQKRDTTGYRQRFAGLLGNAIALANGKKENVFVLSIPDYSVTPYASTSDTARMRIEIDWFNQINKSVTATYGCPYLDITGFTRQGRTNRDLIAGDGLHPSGIDYKRWAEQLSIMIQKVLN
jgi:lysophospholipase L1-like esterase